MSLTLEQILNQLVEIPCITGDLAAAEAIVALATSMLERPGVILKRGASKGFPYFLASSRKPDENTVWFVIHLDVVPGEKELFTVRKDAKNYYGRGVFDMKGMGAAVFAAFRQLPNPADYNVGVLCTTDEEIGGRNGVGAVVGKTFKGAAAFVFDQSADWVLQEKMKGVLWLEITAHGTAAHGARPWLGQSANSALVHYLAQLEAWYKTHMPQTGQNNYYTTFNLGTIHGGEATNQVSGGAVATIDSRFLEEADARALSAAARQLTQKAGAKITVRELLHDACVNNDPNEAWYKAIREDMQTLGITPGPNGEKFGHGSTDGRYFEPYGIPSISVRPPGGAQHGPDEWVGIEGLQQLELLCKKLMERTHL